MDEVNRYYAADEHFQFQKVVLAADYDALLAMYRELEEVNQHNAMLHKHNARMYAALEASIPARERAAFFSGTEWASIGDWTPFMAREQSRIRYPDEEAK